MVIYSTCEVSDVETEDEILDTKLPIEKTSDTENQEKILDTKLDIEKIKLKWLEFVKEVTNKRPSIGTILDSSVPINIVNNTLNIISKKFLELSDTLRIRPVTFADCHSFFINPYNVASF